MSDNRKFSQVYQIEVQGRLDKRWSEWFSGLAIEVQSETSNPPITTLTGTLDQAGLRGVLSKIWDLNLALISVIRLEGMGNPD
jgi:hypothetical protein